jgi:predicted PurR-regulated permease PerM
MARVIEGLGVLLLLSVFFAYMLAPVVAILRLNLRLGARQRPPTNAVAIAIVYAVLFFPLALGASRAAGPVRHWVQVTAPEAVQHLFGRGNFSPLEEAIARAPLPPGARRVVSERLARSVGLLEHETRETLDEMIAAAEHAWWLVVVPIVAFLLLAGAPRFHRSSLRVLRRGHVQWRAEEYLHDVNSALAGYVRAQAVAGVIVGALCVAGLSILGIESAVSMGVAAGVLELVPAIGPLTALLMASVEAHDRLLAVLMFFGVLRLVQDYLIYPRLIQHGMHLPTPVVIVTIWIGAVFGGVAGVILAIPAAGLIAVSVRHWREYRAIERLVAEENV